MLAKDSRSTRHSLRRALQAVCALAFLLAIAVTVRSFWRPSAATAQTPPPGKLPEGVIASPVPADPKKPQIVAVVNVEEITREQLGQQCLWHYGKEVLEALVNKQIIDHECKKRGITITTKEIDAEIDRMAERFGVPTPQWLKLLETERNIKPAQYAKDIIWPTMALQRLAAAKLTVSDAELHEAWETLYGEAVQARLIALPTREEAERVRAQALQNPDSFGNLAKEFSRDKTSAAVKGLVQPIRRHMGNKELEQLAFSLQPGQISGVLQVADQFIFLKCENRYPPREVAMETVKDKLSEAIRDKKLRQSADDLLRELQAASVVDVVYSDPARRAQNPDLAAVVNGHRISVRDLAEECIERHGKEILDHFISRKMIEQQAKQKRIEVTQQELDAEIGRNALFAGKMLPDGQPDIEGWFKTLAEEGITREMYIHDTIWPTAALKRLVSESVTVSDDDLKRGFEANYGPRVRCRAIVVNSMRRAQEVWELARKTPTLENFMALAKEYSVEATTRSLGGEIPPIQRWGGEPTLEAEAFSLKPGELSGVIQVGDNYVILFCEGFTTPKQITLAEVRDLLYEDIFEKKQRLAMTREFDRIRQDSQVDNYLANTSHMPDRLKRKNESLDPGVMQAGANLPSVPNGRPEPPRAGSVLQPAKVGAPQPAAAAPGALPPGAAAPPPGAAGAPMKIRPGVNVPPAK